MVELYGRGKKSAASLSAEMAGILTNKFYRDPVKPEMLG
jgi:hypothetical protein